MIGWLARLLLGREMVENLLWIRENPDAVVDEEMAAWSWGDVDEVFPLVQAA